MRFPSRLSLIVSVSAAAPLGGCITVGPDYAPPPQEAPTHYEMRGDEPAQQATMEATAANREWWRALGSAELDRLIEAAFVESPTITEADAVLDAARAATDAVHGGARPQVGLNSNAERARINPTAFGFDLFPPNTISRYSLGSSISYDLDLFGGNRRARESADARLEAEEYRLEAARLTLAGNVALRAVEIASLSAQISAGEAIVDDDRQTLALVDRAIAGGASGRIDHVRAATQLAQDEADLPVRRLQLAVARHALAALVGRAPGDWAAPDFELADFAPPAIAPISLPSTLVRGRPDIRAAEAALHAAVAQIGVERARLYPNINLTASFAQTALNPDNLFSSAASGWNLGAGLTSPIWRGGALRANARRAEAEAQAADARYRATILRAFVEVADALQAVAASDVELGLQQEAIILAEENLRLARRAYELGAGRLPEVLDAQRQANAARRASAIVQGRRLAAFIQLQAATASRP